MELQFFENKNLQEIIEFLTWIDPKNITKIDLGFDILPTSCENYEIREPKVLPLPDLKRIYEILATQKQLTFLGLPTLNETKEMLEFLDLERFRSLETASINITFNWHILKAI